MERRSGMRKFHRSLMSRERTKRDGTKRLVTRPVWKKQILRLVRLTAWRERRAVMGLSKFALMCAGFTTVLARLMGRFHMLVAANSRTSCQVVLLYTRACKSRNPRRTLCRSLPASREAHPTTCLAAVFSSIQARAFAFRTETQAPLKSVKATTQHRNDRYSWIDS